MPLLPINSMNVYRRVAQYYKPFTGQIIFSLFFVLAGIGMNLLKPWPLKYVIDHILPGKVSAESGSGGSSFLTFDFTTTQDALVFVCLALVAIFLLSGVFNFVSNLLLVKVGLRALLKVRTELYAALQNLPLMFHDQRRTGDSTVRVAYDSQAVQSIFNKGFTNVFGSLITLVATFIVMWRMSVFLTLLSVAILPLVVGVIYYFADRIRKESMDLNQEESDVFSTASEGLGNIRVTHAFGREEHEVNAFQKQAMESLQANLKLTFTNVASALAISTVMAGGTAAMIYFGAQQVISGTISLGDLTVFLAYLSMLYQPLEALSYTAWALEGAASGAQRCFEVLDQTDETKDRPNAVALTSTTGAIEFKNISFAYAKGTPVLKNISFKIPPGKIIALVGGTGSGKTTILSLIPRFYDPADGGIFIDNTDIRDLQKKSLRAQISIVLQDTILLNATIRENIAYGKLNATFEEIVEAAKGAQAHEFILNQPKGYDTPVGERGLRLSVGQRQRIGIARAFLKNSPILLLDEPTSALDPSTEREIMASMHALMKGRTSLMVTHRISTIMNADLILVLKDGAVVESGTATELLAHEGTFKELHDNQMAEKA